MVGYLWPFSHLLKVYHFKDPPPTSPNKNMDLSPGYMEAVSKIDANANDVVQSLPGEKQVKILSGFRSNLGLCSPMLRNKWPNLRHMFKRKEKEAKMFRIFRFALKFDTKEKKRNIHGQNFQKERKKNKKSEFSSCFFWNLNHKKIKSKHFQNFQWFLDNLIQKKRKRNNNFQVFLKIWVSKKSPKILYIKKLLYPRYAHHHFI